MLGRGEQHYRNQEYNSIIYSVSIFFIIEYSIL